MDEMHLNLSIIYHHIICRR